MDARTEGRRSSGSNGLEILYGDGKGNLRKTEFVVGYGWHEGRLAKS